jgi:hypothetical protein
MTDAMELPRRNRNRRAWLRAFWIQLSLGAAMAVGAAIWMGGAPPGRAGGLAVGVGVLLAVSGWFRPEIARVPYRGWNVLARGVARLTRFWVTALLLWVVLFVVGRTGSRMRMGPSPGSGSGWMPAEAAEEVEPGGEVGWARSYLAWARGSGNLWSVVLLPFLWVLASVQDSEERAVPTETYTLY